MGPEEGIVAKMKGLYTLGLRTDHSVMCHKVASVYHILTHTVGHVTLWSHFLAMLLLASTATQLAQTM